MKSNSGKGLRKYVFYVGPFRLSKEEMMSFKKLSVLLVVVMLAALFAACAAPAPQVVEKVVTLEVEKVVTQQVEVEKVVTQVVEKVVEKGVEATPVPAQPSGCNVAAPEKATQVDMLGWAFPITSFYAKELEKCNGVENIRCRHAVARLRLRPRTGPPGSLRQGHLALRNRPCG